MALAGNALAVNRSGASRRVAWLALGYFVSYLLYSLVIKALSLGTTSNHAATAGWGLLPGVVLGATAVVGVAAVAMLAYCCTNVPEWRARRRPIPKAAVTISGLGTAAIVATTTLAYSFHGVSIILALVLMRGGVLIMSPALDALFGRRIHWYSSLALGLASAAVALSILETKAGVIGTAVLVNLLIYLAGYAVRLSVMNRVSKTHIPAETVAYFVAEQLVCYPLLLVGLAAIALTGHGDFGAAVRDGFLALLARDDLRPLAAGMLYGSLFVFGTLIYLDPRENTFCIPLNRSTSLLGGICASLLLAAHVPAAAPQVPELVGAGLVAGALVILLLPVVRRG